MPKNKHIVILTPGFPENETDTTCIPALQIYVKALKEISGYEITVVSVHKPFKNKAYLWNKIPVYAIGGSSSLAKILLWQKVYQTLRQINDDKPITTLHSFWLGECAFLGHWFSKKNSIKHLTTLMGQDALKGNKYARILPLKKLELITLSNFQSAVFYENHKRRTNIIPFGIIPENFYHSTVKTIDIVGVGYLNLVKNHDLFIDVVHQLNQIKPLKAVLIGDGTEQKALQKKIALLQLENVIEMKGELSYNETLKYISQSKILLHTSDFEGFGLVFAEALESKTMIVSKNIGCAFPTTNWAIANTEIEMIQACTKAFSKSFSEKEKNPFTIEKTVHHYIAAYEN
jgi:glycosyltransferase involved in cell wall biosynthesis